MHLAVNFLETAFDDGQFFGPKPWWHVSDDEALRQVAHLIPTTERARRRAKKEEL